MSTKLDTFHQLAFYYEKGRLRTQPKLAYTDIAVFEIINYKGYSYEWWNEFLGLQFTGKMIFHKVNGLQYLYEVLPVKLLRSGVIYGRSIRADCVEMVKEMEVK